LPDSAAPVFAPITITPFGSPKPVSFISLAEVEAWVAAEIAGWEPMHRIRGNVRQFRDHAQLIEALRSAVESAMDDPCEATLAFVRDCLRGLEAPPYLALDCPGSNLVLPEVGRDQWTALALLMLWQGLPFTMNQVDIVALLRAAAIWGATDGGRGDAVARQRKTVRERLGEWEADIARHAERQQKVAADLDQVLADQRERVLALANLHGHHQTALSTLIQTFTEHMRLKAPADYWMDKATAHKTSATKWLRVLMGALGAGCVGLGVAYWLYLYDWIAHLSKDGASAPAAVLLALPGLLYLTLVKVAHKSYRDEVRLAADAEQRTTLVQTYLSLTEGNDNGVLAGERLLALHALFRGTAHSDSPDDTPPVNSLEAIIQSLKPKDR
jgi:hypothetical protein